MARSVGIKRIDALVDWFKHSCTVVHSCLKGLSYLVQSCFSYRSCMSKDSAHSTGHVGHFFPKKCCVTCKKSTRKVLINFGFVTSFEDSQMTSQMTSLCCSDTFMAHELYYIISHGADKRFLQDRGRFEFSARDRRSRVEDSKRPRYWRNLSAQVWYLFYHMLPRLIAEVVELHKIYIVLHCISALLSRKLR